MFSLFYIIFFNLLIRHHQDVDAILASHATKDSYFSYQSHCSWSNPVLKNIHLNLVLSQHIKEEDWNL